MYEFVEILLIFIELLYIACSEMDIQISSQTPVFSGYKLHLMFMMVR